MNEPPNPEVAIFASALEVPADQRGAYLDQACAGDVALRRQVEALLRVHDDAGDFFEKLSSAAWPASARGETAGSSDTIRLHVIPSEKPGDRIGRYRLLQQIGEGGCGVVYMAGQEEPVRRRVALKVIKLGMDTKSVIARFEAERQALALMDHPNIAKVLEAGATDTGRPYFVMELVRGIKITDYCDENNLSTAARLELFVLVCQAIQHAHQKGIIHRDIKPSNILVADHDGVPVPKIIDFGIAKATSDQRLTDKTLFTAFEQFIGTPAYMSPEQAKLSGLDIDTRSDIYSLGVLLYELLMGKTPFESARFLEAGLDEIRRIIREEEPVRPSTRLQTLEASEQTTVARHRQCEPPKLFGIIRGDLDWIVMKALEKDRARRYDTANGLALDLKRYLNNEPVTARPPSAVYRFQKAIRRNRLVFTAAAVVFVVLLLSVVVSTLQARRAAHEARQAEEARKVADYESRVARRAAAQADTRYLLQQGLLPAALNRAIEAYKLGGEWEDGLLLGEVFSTARANWILSARIPVTEGGTHNLLVKTPGGPCLISSTPDVLRAFDARTGTALGTAPLDRTVDAILPGAASNTVAVAFNSAVAIYSLPSLTSITNREFHNGIVRAEARGNTLLLIFQSRDIALYNLSTLAEIDSFNWGTNAVTRSLPFPYGIAVSPDGRLVTLHGGAWTYPTVIWDRRQNSGRFSTQHFHIQLFSSVDDTNFAACYMPSEELGTSVVLYDAGQTPFNMIGARTVPSDDTKGIWLFDTWKDDRSLPLAGIIGPSGVMITGFGGENNVALSDRYANLMPTAAEVPNFLAADLPHGWLALSNRDELLTFRFDPGHYGGNLDDYDSTACREGLVSIESGHTPTSVRLKLTPFDFRLQPMIFSLQWPSDSVWLPWAVATTPDVSTVAVIAQETDSSDNVTSRFGRIRALIYHPGNLQRAPSAWPIQNSFEVDGTTGLWAARFAALDPSGRVLLYWSSVTSVMRYDTREGKLLGPIELGLVSARSRDGNSVAAISPAGRLRVYDLATGCALLDLPGKSASALCFSTDGSRLVASETNQLVIYDVASSRVVSSLASPLWPLAYPSKGDHFLGLEPDASKTGGSVVLADTEDGHTLAVLNRAGRTFTPAFFSDSGDQLALVQNRGTARVVRSLRPEELTAALNTPYPGMDDPLPLMPTNLVTTSPLSISATMGAQFSALNAEDVPALKARLGDEVTLEGRVRSVTLVFARNAANIELEGPDDAGVLVWVSWILYPKLTARLGEDLSAVLTGRTIRVTGRLGMYAGRSPELKNRVQLSLDDPAKFVILPSDGKTPVMK